MNEKKWLGVGKDLSDRQVRNFERGKERSMKYVIGPSADGYLFAPSPNYKPSERGKKDSLMYPSIKGIVLHTTEGWDGGIPTLVDPERRASAHFGVERDGTVIQMVLEKDIAWHGGSSANDWTIGIEVAGFTVRPDGYSNAGKIQVGNTIQENIGFSQAQIESLAKLVADISKRYDIPIDRQHIFGHAHTGSCGNQPRITPSNPYLEGKAGGKSCHYDMGETFNWTEFLKLVKRYRYGNTALLIGIPLVLGAWYLTSRA